MFLWNKFQSFIMHKISEQHRCLQSYGSLDHKCLFFFLREAIELQDKVKVLAQVFQTAKKFLQQFLRDKTILQSFPLRMINKDKYFLATK